MMRFQPDQTRPQQANPQQANRLNQGLRSPVPQVKTDSLPRTKSDLSRSDIETIKSLTRKSDPALANSISIPALAVLLRCNSMAYRKAAAWALGIRGEEETSSILSTSLKTEGNWMVREEIVNSLGSKQSPSSIDSLKSALKDKSHCVRRAAAKSLGKLNASGAKEALIQLVEDDSMPTVRGACLKALATITRAEQRDQGSEGTTGTGNVPQTL
jgi:HEAT repeat protein